MKLITRLLSLSCLSLSLVACLPRGETKTLDQILKNAQSSFQQTSLEAVPAEARKHVDGIADQLAKLVNGQSSDAVTADLAASLRALIPFAGYTSRASFAELASQLEQSTKSSVFDAAAAKLIATRIYSAITVEVATTHFGVSVS